MWVWEMFQDTQIFDVHKTVVEAGVRKFRKALGTPKKQRDLSISRKLKNRTSSWGGGRDILRSPKLKRS